MASADLIDELNCSICLNIYTDPVSLSCGHNFCRACIRRALYTQDGAGVYTCPECRAEFQERPALQRNMKLCNITERFLTAQPEKVDCGIFCTYCVHAPVPAAKTCLHCEASLCDLHLGVHSKSTEHVLTEPIPSPENRKCSVHKEALKYYCPQDADCICVSCCVFGEHRGHHVELVTEAFEKKKEKMRNYLEKLNSSKDEAEKTVQDLQEHRKELQDKAGHIAEYVAALFMDIRKQLEALEKRVLSEISRQKEKISFQISDMIQRLYIKKETLSRKMSVIETMCSMTDPITVLQGRKSNKASVGVEMEDEDLKRDDHKGPTVDDLDGVLVSVTLHAAVADVLGGIRKGTPAPEPSDISLNVHTAANSVVLSGDLKTASWSEISQSRPKTQKRFITFCQVLSNERFSSGRHYWELETSDLGNWRVGVACPSMERKGDQSSIGYNSKSWCLRICKKDYSVVHDSKETALALESPVRRLGIYLDYEGGRLSFYQLSNPIAHIHTFTASFTEPLHVAFLVWKNGWVGIRS